MRRILKCPGCGLYTLNKECKCGGVALTVRPPKYSVDDRYAEYRRRAKEELKKDA